MSGATRFRQSDVTRAIRAAEAAGMRVGRFEIDPNGKIVVIADWTVPRKGANSWDRVL